MKRLLVVLLTLGGCAEPPVEPGLKAIVGGRLEASANAPAIPYAVIVIAEGKIRAIGAQASTPVPKGAETIAAKGMLVRPVPFEATLAPGAPADLMLLDAETRVPGRVMRAGEWVP